jgi:hypothetical protein
MAVVALSIAIWLFGLPLNAQAKPKSKAFGCTTANLNTNFGSSCVSQAEQDIIRGHSYIHVLVCEAQLAIRRIKSKLAEDQPGLRRYQVGSKA